MGSNTLAKGIEIIGILFAAFGGFLAGIAPPQAADAKFAVGISSFLALIILFTIAALSRKRHQKSWVVTAFVLFIIAVGSAYYYKTLYNHLVFSYPPGNTQVEHIAGTELMPLAREYKKQHQSLSNSQLLAKFGGLQNKGSVWTETSVERARTKLIGSYMILVLSIASAIFALTEGALVKIGRK
jgi:TRAP-type uncharacterized transport system fused permease subunit